MWARATRAHFTSSLRSCEVHGRLAARRRKPSRVSSDLEVLLDVGERDARHREVGARAIEDDVEEERRARTERANEVVLLRQRDEHVLDHVLEAEVAHRLPL